MSEPAESKDFVFVYGTLRRGGSNAFRMDGAQFIGKGRVEGKLYVISWYPGLVSGRDLGWVNGDVFCVGPEQMRTLDEFEGLAAGEIEGSEYRRVKVPLLLEGIPHEETHYAWVYEWKGPGDEARRVRSGDWLDVSEPGASSAFTWVATCATAALLLPFFAFYWRRGHGGRVLEELLIASVYGLPLVGIAAAVLAGRRREAFAWLRKISLAVCTVWLAIWVFLGLVAIMS